MWLQICLKRTNLKSEKERKHMVFWSEVPLQQVEKYLRHDAKKGVPRWQFRHMLPSQKRLSRSNFTKLLAFGDSKTTFNNLGTLKYREASNPRVAVVISSKIEKRAVYRNKLRRRIYSIFLNYFQDHPKCGWYILHVSKKAVSLEYKEMKALLYDLLKKTTK